MDYHHSCDKKHIMTRRLPWASALALLAACGRIAHPPAVPASFHIEQHELGIDPDGSARWLLTARFYDARHRPLRVLSGTNVDWRSPDGEVQWQNRMRFGQPSAIVKTTRAGLLHADIRVTEPQLGAVELVTDTRRWNVPRTVAQALGPHAVQLGWFPRADGRTTIVRDDETTHETRRFVTTAPSSFRDISVRPAHRYRYDVRTPSSHADLVVTTPSALRASIGAVRGIGMWLSFSNNPIDPDYAGRWHTSKIVALAARAHLRFVELRLAYGAFFEITPDVKANVDALIDGLASHGIATIAWSVPRNTSFDDLAASIAAASYRTQLGTPIAGLAVDLERGSDFMSGAGNGVAALWQYAQSLREALGPRYPIVATVEDPYFGHLDNAAYPYDRIASYASALQPMSYWRMMERRPTTPAQVRRLLPAAVARLRALAGHPVPVSLGGQTAAQGPNGHPPAAEIGAAVAAAKASGALGICFFDFAGTTPAQWHTLAKLKY